MNQPVLAGVLAVAVVFSLVWFVWIGTREPRRSAAIAGFVVWAVPLFYVGGWSAGASLGETTFTFLMILGLLLIRLLRDAARDWSIRQAERISGRSD